MVVDVGSRSYNWSLVSMCQGKANSGTFKAREQSRPDTELIQKVAWHHVALNCWSTLCYSNDALKKLLPKY